jgi:hypothetical protein
MAVIVIDSSETATILAALRVWQYKLEAGGFTSSEIIDIVTNFGTIEKLKTGDIDSLCEKINASPSTVRAVVEVTGGVAHVTKESDPSVSVLIVDYDNLEEAILEEVDEETLAWLAEHNPKAIPEAGPRQTFGMSANLRADVAALQVSLADAEESEEPPLHQCGNCARAFLVEQLEPIKDIAERLAPGDTVPSGECPSCHALCYPVDMEEAGACLVSACEAQHAYWDALHDLEAELGVDIDDIGDMEGLTIKDVIDSFGPDGFGGTEDNEG